MRIVQCFPSAATRAGVVRAAEALGLVAWEEGLCVHFDPPKDLEALNKIRVVLRTRPDASAQEAEPLLVGV